MHRAHVRAVKEGRFPAAETRSEMESSPASRHCGNGYRESVRLRSSATMGNCTGAYAGYARGARSARLASSASIFVNRLQFAAARGFRPYREPSRGRCDSSLLRVDVVFAPGETELYPEPQNYLVRARRCEAARRRVPSGFFRGWHCCAQAVQHRRPAVAVFERRIISSSPSCATWWPLCRRSRSVAGETTARRGRPRGCPHATAPIRAGAAEAPRLARTLQTVREALLAGDRIWTHWNRKVPQSSIESWKVHYVAITKAVRNLQKPDTTGPGPGDSRRCAVGQNAADRTILRSRCEPARVLTNAPLPSSKNQAHGSDAI